MLWTITAQNIMFLRLQALLKELFEHQSLWRNNVLIILVLITQCLVDLVNLLRDLECLILRNLALKGSKYIFVFNASTKQLISRYLGYREACKALGMHHETIRKHLISGEPYKGMIFSNTHTV